MKKLVFALGYALSVKKLFSDENKINIIVENCEYS